MARLIDADKFILALMDASLSSVDEDTILDLVDSIHTVDAITVVRCKDCKHYSGYGKTSLFVDGKNIKAGWCVRRIRYDEEFRIISDGFCSYGERRTDNV